TIMVSMVHFVKARRFAAETRAQRPEIPAAVRREQSSIDEYQVTARSLAEQDAEHGGADVDVVLRHVDQELVQEVLQYGDFHVIEDLVVIQDPAVEDRHVVQIAAQDVELVVVEHADVLDVDVDRQHRDRSDTGHDLDVLLVDALETTTGILRHRG